jgi:hypothetical protein
MTDKEPAGEGHNDPLQHEYVKQRIADIVAINADARELSQAASTVRRGATEIINELHNAGIDKKALKLAVSHFGTDETTQRTFDASYARIRAAVGRPFDPTPPADEPVQPVLEGAE